MLKNNKDIELLNQNRKNGPGYWRAVKEIDQIIAESKRTGRYRREEETVQEWYTRLNYKTMEERLGIPVMWSFHNKRG